MKPRSHLQGIASLALLCAATASHAQTATPLIGPALGVAVQSLKTDVPYTSSVTSINGQSSSASDTDISLLGSWGYAITDQWVTMVGLSYGLSKSDLGRINYTAGGAQNFTAKTKDHLSLFVAPGYRVHPQAVLYAKLAYHRMTAEYSDTATDTSSRTFTGRGAGAGLAYTLGRTLELRLEYETVRYQSEVINLTTGKPEQDILSGALLYKF